MKRNKILILLSSAALLLSACGNSGNNSSKTVDSSTLSSIESVDSRDNNSSSETPQREQFNYGLGGLPQIDDDAKHDAGEWTETMFREKIEDTYYEKCNIKSFKYAKDVYLRSTSALAKHEMLRTDYEFKEDKNLGTILTGYAEVEAGHGVINTQPLSAPIYSYNIQAYAAAGYLHYIEKVNVLPNTTAVRISYDSISKNNRYSNMWTHYSSNPDLVLIENAYDLIMGRYDEDATEIARYIDTSTDEVIYKVATNQYVAYTDYNYVYFMYAHANKQTKKLTRIDYGWLLYDPFGEMTNDDDIQTIRVESIFDFDYSKKAEFNGTLLTEKDVDKVYGGPAQHVVDYSSWKDGVLDDEQSKEILSNLQSFGSNTMTTKGTYSIDKFVDPNNSVDDDGEFIIQGSLRGSFETKKYKNDFVETKALNTLSTDEGTVISEFSSVIQAEAHDDGMYVIEDYATPEITNHKHTWGYNEVDDVDPYIGVNPIFKSEIFHPFQVAGTYGANNPGTGDDDEELPTNYYITEGQLIKNGNTITASFSKIYHKNIWTPYWTYTASFKIEDGFLSETALSVSSYYETDSSSCTIKSSFSFVNTKGTDHGEFKGSKLNPAGYEESELLAKNESLYK